MAASVQIPPPGFEDLSIDEKIAYVQSLWDLVHADAATAPVPDWQKRILDERLAELEANPDSAIPWEEVFGRLSSEIKAKDAVE